MTPEPSPLTDAELVAAFGDGGLDPARFGHRDHVRVAWLLLRRHPLPEALWRVERGLETLARKGGAPEKYHATVTWAWMLLVRERVRRGPRDDAWAAFARRNADLFTDGGRLLARHYSPELLASERARREFVLPDRAVPRTSVPA